MRLTRVIRSEKLLSNVHRGTAFEYRALSLLTEHMSMSLTRVGGCNDGGVDLIGWWWIPSREKTGACPLLCAATERVFLSQIPKSLESGVLRIAEGCVSSLNAKPKRGRWGLDTCVSSKVSSTDMPRPPLEIYRITTRLLKLKPHQSRSSSPNPSLRVVASSLPTRRPSRSSWSISHQVGPAS